MGGRAVIRPSIKGLRAVLIRVPSGVHARLQATAVVEARSVSSMASILVAEAMAARAAAAAKRPA
jgi:hypothetical protein